MYKSAMINNMTFQNKYSSVCSAVVLCGPENIHIYMYIFESKGYLFVKRKLLHFVLCCQKLTCIWKFELFCSKFPELDYLLFVFMINTTLIWVVLSLPPLYWLCLLFNGLHIFIMFLINLCWGSCYKINYVQGELHKP